MSNTQKPKLLSLVVVVAVVLVMVVIVWQIMTARGTSAESGLGTEIDSIWPFNSDEAQRRQREAADDLGVPVEKTVDLGGGVTMEMVLIPAGEFMMGSSQSPEEVARLGDGRVRLYEDEHPQHRVRITESFYIGKYEVTQAQWERFMRTNHSYFRGANLPVEAVSWEKCREFINKLNELGIGKFRLPNEAEWEYACRAGTATPFYFGDTISTDQANYDGNYVYGDGPEGVYLEKTTPAGSFPPNAWGLYDMHGNVWEWCLDWYDEAYYAKSPDTDPNGPDEGSQRVLRGGSFYYYPSRVRSAERRGGTPGNPVPRCGFRVVLTELP